VRAARTSRAAASSDAEKIAGRIVEYAAEDLAADAAGGADHRGGHRPRACFEVGVLVVDM